MAVNSAVTGDVYFQLDGKLLEISRQLRVPGGYSGSLFELNTALQKIIDGQLKAVPFEDQLYDWKVFYEKHLDFKSNFSRVKIPRQNHRCEFDRLIAIPAGLTLERAMVGFADVLKGDWTQFTDYPFTLKHRREEDYRPTGGYAILTPNLKNPDKHWVGVTLPYKSVRMMTWLERIMLGFKWYIEREEHIDDEVSTICGGTKVFTAGSSFSHPVFDKNQVNGLMYGISPGFKVAIREVLV